MNPDVTVHTGQLDARGLRVAIVASRFNEAVVDRLVDGAVDQMIRHGAVASDIEVAWVAGAWELPIVARTYAASGSVDAIVAIGAVVRGSTPHFEYVAGAAANGCAAVQQEYGIPVAFGVLTTNTWDEAVERAGGKLGNKGGEAAMTAVETANLIKDIAAR